MKENELCFSFFEREVCVVVPSWEDAAATFLMIIVVGFWNIASL